MTISRGQMNRQLYMGGGIMNARPRQQYGLGSFVKKAVKKVTGGVKDIVSSDLGKAALAGAAVYGLGGGTFGGLRASAPGFSFANLPGAGFFGSGSINPLKTLVSSEGFSGLGPSKFAQFLGTGKGKLAAGGVLASLFAGMSAADQADIDEVDIDERGDVVAEKLRQSLTRLGYTGQVLEDKVAEGVAEYTGYTSKAEGGRIGYAEGTEEPLEPINIGIGTFNPQRVVDLYEKAKNIPKNISLEDISLEDIKGIPKRLMEGTKSSVSSMVEPLGNEYRAYKKFFSLPKKDKKKMEEMGLGIFDVFEYLAMKNPNEPNQRLSENDIIRMIEMKDGILKPMKNSNEPNQRLSENDIIRMIEMKDGILKPVKKAKGGLMGIPVRKNSEGTTELDYRKSGGFVPIGVKEKADDVPAMLSKNEFVMTADAVRAAGGGSIEKGAQKMYDTMKKLESRVA